MGLFNMVTRRVRKLVAWAIAAGVLFILLAGAYFIAQEAGVI